MYNVKKLLFTLHLLLAINKFSHNNKSRENASTVHTGRRICRGEKFKYAYYNSTVNRV